MRTYLDVPFEEKEAAKSLGAKWDWQEKRWYAPNEEKELIDRWKSTLEEITILYGEDPTFGGNELYVDLVPRSCWFTNVRYCIEPKDWVRLRRFVNQRAENRCECCNKSKSLEAHERWEYDECNHVQKLIRIIGICKDCHEVTHMGLAQIRGREEAALSHLMMVRNWDKNSAEMHVKDAFNLWEKRNSIEWELDLSIIINSGINLIKKVNKFERRTIAEAVTKEKREFESEMLLNYDEPIHSNNHDTCKTTTSVSKTLSLFTLCKNNIKSFWKALNKFITS